MTTITQIKKLLDIFGQRAEIGAALPQEYASQWKLLQFELYCAMYEQPIRGLSDEDVQRFKILETIFHRHPVIDVMIGLHQPQTLVRGGDFVTLRLHDRWHLLTVRTGRIRTVHFMQASGAWRLWNTYRQAPNIESYTVVGEHFGSEVVHKILMNATDYLPWSRQGLELLVGDTSEDIQSLAIKNHPDTFVFALQKIMDTEAIGLALLFPDN